MIELFSLFFLTLSPAGCDPAARVLAQPVKADVTTVESASSVVENGETFDAVIAPTGRVDDKANAVQSSSAAQLPRVYLDFQFPAVSGRKIEVEKGDNLQKALNSAKRGDEIVLEAGATFTGNFVLPEKSGTAADGWIVIRSDKLGQFPAIGTRVTPAQASLMPKIVTPNTDPALKTATEASGWWLAGLEITVAPSLTVQQYGIVALGDNSRAQSTLASVASDLVLDRMYIHGQTTTNTSRCIALNSARTQISDSYIVECHGRGFDSQAIWGGNGPGPFKIVNNMLQGAGENIMFGGQDPVIPGLVPSDIEIRRNYIYTPLSWKGVWTKKNLFETKNAARVLFEANVLDGSWTDGQTGWAIIMKSGNQSGGCRWCRSTDITIRRNLIRNVGAGIGIGPKDDNPNTDTTARRILVIENVLEDVGSQPGDQRGFSVFGGVADVTLERNVLSGKLSAALLLDTQYGGALRSVFKDNIWTHGTYGVIASGWGPGTVSLQKGAPGFVWTRMSLIGAPQTGYPGGTTWLSTEGRASLAEGIRSRVAESTAGVAPP